MLTKKLIFAATWVLMFAVSGVQAGGDPTKGKELAQKCDFCPMSPISSNNSRPLNPVNEQVKIR